NRRPGSRRPGKSAGSARGGLAVVNWAFFLESAPMSLDIQFVEVTPEKKPRLVSQSQLREEANAWLLPQVILAPVDQLAHLTWIGVKVAGKPETVAQRLERAFFTKPFDPPEQLSHRRGIGG